MRRFIFQCLLFFSILVLLFVAIGLLPRRSATNNFLYGIAIKHRLADSIKKPKIILVGGSNVGFSFNSRKIADSLGMPVVNMGMHIQLGLTFMLNEAKDVIRPGDIVFLCPEYMISMKGRWQAKNSAATFYPHSKAYYPWDPVANLGYIVDYNRIRLKEFFAREIFDGTDSVYYSGGFDNTNGDVDKHIYKHHHPVLASSNLKYAYWDGIRAINDFANYAQTRNVRTYYVFPTLAVSSFEKNSKVISHFESDIRKGLKIPVLGTPADFEYPDSLYYDTEYHLLKTGRNMRTDELIHLAKTNPAVKSFLPLNRPE